MSGSETQLDQLRRVENRVLERVRGAALALLTKVAPNFTKATAQPVVKVRAANGETVVAGPTPDAPVLVFGTGGFELSMCADANDAVLSLPLESDHANFLKSGKISDPATPRVHDRGLAVSLPFAFKKALAAAAGEIYLGHAGKSLYLKINRNTLVLELEVAGVGAKIKIGKGALKGAARLDDPVVMSGALMTYLTNLSAAVPFAAPVPNMTIGTISGASGKVVIE
jgi:hypothetical protein